MKAIKRLALAGVWLAATAVLSQPALAAGPSCTAPGAPPSNTLPPQPTPPTGNPCATSEGVAARPCANPAWTAYTQADSAWLQKRTSYLAKLQRWANSAQAYACCERPSDMLGGGTADGTALPACPK